MEPLFNPVQIPTWFFPCLNSLLSTSLNCMPLVSLFGLPQSMQQTCSTLTLVFSNQSTHSASTYYLQGSGMKNSCDSCLHKKYKVEHMILTFTRSKMPKYWQFHMVQHAKAVINANLILSPAPHSQGCRIESMFLSRNFFVFLSRLHIQHGA